MELQNNYDVIVGLDAEVIAIAQEESDHTTLAHTRQFVKHDYPTVADPKRESWETFDRYGVYIVDKKGVVRSFLPGSKEARPRLDLVLEELAAVAGKPVPAVDYDAGKIAVKREATAHPKVDSAEEAVAVRWMWSHPKIRPGGAFKLAFLPTVAPGYHVYGMGEKQMVPFSVELKLPDGLQLAGPIEYPQPEVRHDDALDMDLRIYEGDIPLSAINLEASESLAPGTVKVVVALHYQACDESSCFPPTTVNVELDLEVVKSKRRLPGVAGWRRW